jgi:hypothetical protein
MQSRFQTTSVIPGPPCWASHVSRALPPRGDRPEPLLPLAFRPTFNWINALLHLTTAPRCQRAVVAPVRVFGGGRTRGEGSAADKMHGPPWCLYALSSTISARLGLTEKELGCAPGLCDADRRVPLTGAHASVRVRFEFDPTADLVLADKVKFSRSCSTCSAMPCRRWNHRRNGSSSFQPS